MVGRTLLGVPSVAKTPSYEKAFIPSNSDLVVKSTKVPKNFGCYCYRY
jgi:hypothetical protein